jgi:crotonobetainyl-CoA:carnitine CoA-transferase CaiB-like acyl-CoA transferase
VKPLCAYVLLDLTHMLAGPYGAMILADLGMQTIKIEPPITGDATRRLLARDPDNSLNGMGAYSLTLNRNKQSVGIDLKCREGVQIFQDLVAAADVVFENFSPGVTKRLGIDHERLAAINARIITCSVSGFGQDGPDPNRPAFDMIAQGLGGGMSITGGGDGGPMRAGVPIGDLGGGVFGAIGVLSALLAREQTGRGQHVDISMLDCQISLLSYMATMFSLSGRNPAQMGNGHPVHAPYNAFRTKTRHINICCILDHFWDALAETLKLDDLRTEQFARQPGRLPAKAMIEARVQAVLELETCEHWLQLLRGRVPCGAVNDFAHALNDPQVRARNMVVTVAHPAGGTVEMPGNPIKMSDTPAEDFAPPPLVGQDTERVLTELLGYSGEKIAKLRAQGAIG